MVRYLKKIRIADSLANLTLSEFQKELIPYFNKNVLNHQPNEFKPLKTINTNES